MEASRRKHDQALPSGEVALDQELPEIRPNRLDNLAARLKNKSAAEKAPEFPPPLQLEELVIETTEPVEVEIEEVAEEARQRLDEVYEEAPEVEIEAIEELPTEAEYELRAEVKKEPEPTDEEKGLAAKVSLILADLHQKTAAAHAAFGRIRERSSPRWRPELPAIVKKLPPLYRRAMLTGFSAAAVIIVVSVLMTLTA